MPYLDTIFDIENNSNVVLEYKLESVIIKFCEENNIQQLDFDCSVNGAGNFYNIKKLDIKDLDIINN